MTKASAGVLDPPTAWNFTGYMRDAGGNVMNTVASSNGPYNPTSDYGIYGSSRLGTWVPYAPSTHMDGLSALGDEYRLAGDKMYELTNHLGNVMVTVTDKKHGYDTDADGVANNYHAHVISMTDYYAFGMQMPGRLYSSGYRYGFNGKEKDDEVKTDGNALEFGGRSIYDPRLARFVSVDPRVREFPFMSPYCFAANSPIIFIDIDGKGPGFGGVGAGGVSLGMISYILTRSEQLQAQGYTYFGALVRAESEVAAAVLGLSTLPILIVESAPAIAAYAVSNAPQLIALGITTKELVQRNPKLIGDAATFVAELLNPGATPVQSPYDGEELAIALKSAGKVFNQKVGTILASAFESKMDNKLVSKVIGTLESATKKFKDLIGNAEVITRSENGKEISIAKLKDGTTVTLRNFSGSEPAAKAVIDINSKAVGKGAKTKGIEIKFFEQEK